MDAQSYREQVIQEYDDFAGELQRSMKIHDDFLFYYRMVFAVHLIYTLVDTLALFRPDREGDATLRYGGAIGIASGVLILLEWYNTFRVSYTESLARIPALLYVIFLLLIGITWVAIVRFDPDWSLIAHGILVLLLFSSWMARSGRCKAVKSIRKQVEDLAATLKSRRRMMTDPIEPAKSRCTICEQESQYDVCLACEKAFQGERHRVRAQILRAKQAGVPATLTLAEWLDTLHTFHSCCAYCYAPFQLIEHYVPISQGGGTTKENCVPACFRCNSKKSGKHPER